VKEKDSIKQLLINKFVKKFFMLRFIRFIKWEDNIFNLNYDDYYTLDVVKLYGLYKTRIAATTMLGLAIENEWRK